MANRASDSPAVVIAGEDDDEEHEQVTVSCNMLDVTMGAPQIFEEVQLAVESIAIADELEVLEAVSENENQVDGHVC